MGREGRRRLHRASHDGRPGPQRTTGKVAGALIPGQGCELYGGLSASFLLGACGEEDPGSPSASPSAPATSASAAPSATPSASASPSPSKTPKPVPPSNNFDKVTVSGEYGQPPKVTVKAPWAIDKTRSEVLTPSEGDCQAGPTVEVNYTG